MIIKYFTIFQLHAIEMTMLSFCSCWGGFLPGSSTAFVPVAESGQQNVVSNVNWLLMSFVVHLV